VAPMANNRRNIYKTATSHLSGHNLDYPNNKADSLCHRKALMRY
jgi:hypothetical protein